MPTSAHGDADRIAHRASDALPPALTVVRTLGAFEIYRDGIAVGVPHGLPRQAIKLVVARGGSTHVELLADTLWPDAGTSEQLKGVRNVLARLSRSDCPMLVRDGDAVRLSPGVVVDSFSFRAAADRALLSDRSPESLDTARTAVSKYGGDFLPDDLYAEWSIRVREQLRRRYVALLDLLATQARAAGALLDAAHLLETAIEADPSDDVRYLEAAEIHIAAGRRGRAAELLARARGVLDDLGLQPDAGWHRVDSQLRRPEQPTRAVSHA